jgi:hypothetical protein
MKSRAWIDVSKSNQKQPRLLLPPSALQTWQQELIQRRFALIHFSATPNKTNKIKERKYSE